MKSCSPGLFKQAISLFMAILKAKSVAVKSKASAVKTRFIIFKLLHDKNALVGAFPRQKNELSFGEERASHHDGENEVVLHQVEEDDGFLEERYDRLQQDDEFVRDFGERDGEFDGENEVDRAADVFIRKFHEEMMIQKQESFKMYQEMVARGSL